MLDKKEYFRASLQLMFCYSTIGTSVFPNGNEKCANNATFKNALKCMKCSYNIKHIKHEWQKKNEKK